MAISLQEERNIPGNSDTCVLILTSDRYADLWHPFFTLFFRYWKDCPYTVYLGANKKKYDDQRVVTVQSGEPKDWASDTLSILKQIPEQYVILLLEDYFLTAPADSDTLRKSVQLMKKDNADFMRLGCFPESYNDLYPFTPHPSESFAVVTESGALYALTLQAGIWKRESFIELLIPGETPWDFEIEGSKRATKKKFKMLGIKPNPEEDYVHGPISYLCTAVTKGVWMREALELCEKEKINADFSQRPIETEKEQRKRILKRKLPWFMQSIMDKFNK